MAVTNSDLLIKIAADVSGAAQNVDLLTKKIEKLSEAQHETAEASQKTATHVEHFGSKMFEAEAFIEIAKKGMEKFVEVLKESVGDFINAEKANRNLSVALATLGEYSKDGAEKWKEYADELEATTGISDDLIKQLTAQAKLLGQSDEQTKKMIETAIGFSTVLGGNVTEAFDKLAGSLKGSARSLSMYNSGISGLNETQLRAGGAVDLLATKYRDLAEFAGTGLPGSIAKNAAAFEQLRKTIGEIIVTVLGFGAAKDGMTAKFTEFNTILKDNKETIIAWGKTFLGVFDFLLKAIATFEAAFLGMAGAVGGAFGTLGTIGAKIGNFFGVVSDQALASVQSFTKSADELAQTGAGAVKEGLKDMFVGGSSAAKDMSKEVDKTKEALTRLNEEGLKGRGFKAMTDEGKKGLEELKKKIEELNKIQQTAGQDETGQIMGKVAAQQIEISLIETKLKKGYALSAQAREQIQLARDIANANGMAELAKAQKKNFDELHKETADLALMNNRENLTTKAFLEQKLDLELAILKTKYDQMSLDEKGRDELETKMKLMKSQTAIAVKNGPSEDFENTAKPGKDLAKDVTSITNGAATGAAGIIGGAMAGAGAVMSAVSGLLDFVQQLIDFIPQILSKVANIFNSLTDLPKKIVQGVKDLGKALVGFVKDFLPNLFNMITDLLTEMIDHAFTKMPEAVINMVKGLPDMIMGFTEKLPDIIEKLVAGIVSNGPRLVIGIVEGFVKGIPKIMIGTIKAIPTLIMSIIKGVIKGLANIGNLFKGSKIENPIDTKALANTMKQAAKSLTTETSKLFKVMDLTDAGASLKDKSQQILDELRDGMNNWLEKLLAVWRAIWDFLEKYLFGPLRALWQWIWDAFDKYIVQPLRAVWQWVYDNVIGPIIDGLRAVWNFVIDNVVNPLVGGLSKAWQWVVDNVIAPLQNIGGAISSAFSGLGDFFKNFGSMIWDGLKGGLDNLPAFFTNLFDKLNPMNLFAKIFKVDMGGKGKVESTLGIDIPFMNFATGGTVPGKAAVPGDSIMNDRIVALLSPGEAVIPRSLMNNPAVGNLVESILSGKIKVPAYRFGGRIGSSISGAAKSAGGAISQGAKDVGGAAAGAYQSAIAFAKDPLAGLWDQVWTQIKDMIFKMFDSNKLSTGGLITGKGIGDSVPSLLMPGEFVMSKGAVGSLGVDNVSAMNNGARNGSSSNSSNQAVNINLTINTTQPLDNNYVKNTMMPMVKEELRKASLNGERVIYSGGIR